MKKLSTNEFFRGRNIMKKLSTNEFNEKIFDLKKEKLGELGWLWWFWLFFLENPSNPEKPKQVAIIWSIKNDNNIKCNGKQMGVNKIFDSEYLLNGGVTAWYFDGSKMHKNFLLDKVKIKKDFNGIYTFQPKTRFFLNDETFNINIKNKMRFKSEFLEDKHTLISPWSKKHKYFGVGYELLEVNKLNTKAVINNKSLRGTAFFQKVLLNAPAPSWYWGIFHFNSNAYLSYFRPYLSKKSLKKNISFYDGKTMHKFNNIEVTRKGKSLPSFHIKAKDKKKSIDFLVETYSKASWNFNKKKLGFTPINFKYREYPAKITQLEFKDGNKIISEDDIGLGVGNSEHSTGVLI